MRRHARPSVSGSRSRPATRPSWPTPRPVWRWQAGPVPKRSAGVVLFRRGGGSFEVLVVHPGGPLWARRDAGAWSIPKGEVDGDDGDRTTATREFEEELGTPPPTRAWTDLGEVIQSGGKRVHAWAVEGDLDGPRSTAARSRSSGHRARGVARASPRSTGPSGSTRRSPSSSWSGAGRPSSSACSTSWTRTRPASRPPPRTPRPADIRRRTAPPPRRLRRGRDPTGGASRARARRPGGWGTPPRAGETLVGQDGQEAPAVRRAPGPVDQAPADQSVDHPADRRLSDIAPRAASSLIRSAAVGRLREVHQDEVLGHGDAVGDLQLGLEHPGHDDEGPGQGRARPAPRRA